MSYVALMTFGLLLDYRNSLKVSGFFRRRLGSLADSSAIPSKIRQVVWATP